jgi:hypothetical protein
MSRHQFKTVEAPIDALLLDTVNPRIRSAETQQECINLVMKKQSQMMKLIKSIAQDGLGTMPILLFRPDTKKSKWVVKDGNRRITALKLLNNPALCSEDSIREQIKAISEQYKMNIPTSIDCLESSDLQVLNREVLARHGGAMEGVGQLGWEAYLRTVFQLTSGLTADNKRAGQYLLWAERNGIPVDDDFPVTTLTRFFSESNLHRLGFDIKNDELTPILTPEKLTRLTLKVITDFGVNKLNVSEVFTAELASKYIDQVRKSAQIEDTDDTQPTGGESFDQNKGAGAAGVNGQQHGDAENDEHTQEETERNGPRAGRPTQPKKPTWDRLKLFHKGAPAPAVPSTENKLRNLIVELKDINVKKAPHAVAALLRAVLELSSNHYLEKNALRADNLAKRILKSAEHMEQGGALSTSQLEYVRAICNSDKMQSTVLNIDTLQKFLHRESHNADYQVINTFWDNLACYVQSCWR